MATELLISDECLPTEVEYYSNKQKYVECQVQRAWINTYVGVTIAVIIMIIMLFVYRESTGGMLMVGIIGTIVIGLMLSSPYFRGIFAGKEYEKMEQEYSGSKEREPDLSWKDFLKRRLSARQAKAAEMQARAQISMANSQNTMATLGTVNTVANLFGKRH